MKQKLIDAEVLTLGHILKPDGRHTDTVIDMDALYLSSGEGGAFDIIVNQLRLIGEETTYGNQKPYHLNCNCDIIACTPGCESLVAPIAHRVGKPLVWVEKIRSGEERIRQWDTKYGITPDIVRDVYDLHLRPAFAEAIRGKKILLITDVIETGKTVTHSIKCIQDSGADVIEVRCLQNNGYKVSRGDYTKGENIPIPILSLISAESWTPEECPMCKEDMRIKGTEQGK